MTRRPPFAQVESIFKRVTGVPLSERAELIASLCGDDHVLREAVERLLKFNDAPDGVLDKPAMGGTVAAASSGDFELEPGMQLGAYAITGRIGHGGMGVVYTARQQRPNRDVALKVIRPELASRSMLRRFEQEADILARLQHPGIAQVFEAGVFPTASGERAFIAMELIDGKPLDAVCRDTSVTLRTKLELLVDICDALDHAHERGVIHRDLKPANILVVKRTATPLPDRSGETRLLSPKILDFGVARAVEREPGATMVTQAGQIVGTPAYMSPEQFAADPGAIDTRSDIYTLGVLAYEMLVGRLPHEPMNRSVMDMAAAIRDETPTRLGDSDRSLRGDIETIVARAMSKEPARRYQTARDMGADIRRHLASEPIDAKRDSTLYVLSRRVKRNPRMYLALGGLTLVIAISAVALARSIREKSRLTDQNERISEDASRSEAAKAAAQTQMKQLAGMLRETLLNMRSLAAPGKDVTVIRELMEQTRKQVDQTAIAEPGVEAEVRMLMGDIYFCLKMVDQATAQHERGVVLFTKNLDKSTPAYTRALCRLAADRRQQRNIAEARVLFDRALAALETQREVPPTHRAEVALNAAEVRWTTGEYEEAELLARGTAEVIENDPSAFALRVSAFGTYGQMLLSVGKPKDAVAYFTKGVAVVREVGHEVRGVLADTLNRLAVAKIESDDAAGAEKDLLESMEIERSFRGENAPALQIVRINLACVYHLTGRDNQAELLLDAAAVSISGAEEGELTLPAADLLEPRIAALRQANDTGQASVVEKCVRDLRTRASRHHGP